MISIMPLLALYVPMSASQLKDLKALQEKNQHLMRHTKITQYNFDDEYTPDSDEENEDSLDDEINESQSSISKNKKSTVEKNKSETPKLYGKIKKSRQYKFHLSEQSEKTQCSQSIYTTANKANMDRHKLNQYNIKTHICFRPDCKQEFNNYQLRAEHIKKGHGTSKEDFLAYCNSPTLLNSAHVPQCFDCKKPYASEEDRQTHLREHEFAYVCPDCYWTFLPNNRGSFLRHLKNWHGFSLSASKDEKKSSDGKIKQEITSLQVQKKTNQKISSNLYQLSQPIMYQIPQAINSIQNMQNAQNSTYNDNAFSFDLDHIEILPNDESMAPSNSPLKPNAQEFLLF